MKELDKKRWVNTADVVEFLKSDPDREHEFSRYVGAWLEPSPDAQMCSDHGHESRGVICSTYWMEYKSDKNMFALSRDWIRPDYYTEEELLECYEGYWWNLTC
jgi:hypothetical protein